MKNIFLILTLAFTLIVIGSCAEKKKKSTNEFKLDESNLSPLDKKILKGKIVYEKICQTCHMADGKGVEKTFPPLAGSDFFAEDKLKMVANIVFGLKGEVIVNGVKFNGEMPKQIMSDQEVADVATYVLNSFGNKGGEVSLEEVDAVKKSREVKF